MFAFPILLPAKSVLDFDTLRPDSSQAQHAVSQGSNSARLQTARRRNAGGMIHSAQKCLAFQVILNLGTKFPESGR